MCSNQLAVLQCLYVQQYLASHPINTCCLQHRVRVRNSLSEEQDETGNLLHTVFYRVPTANIQSASTTEIICCVCTYRLPPPSPLHPSPPTSTLPTTTFWVSNWRWGSLEKRLCLYLDPSLQHFYSVPPFWTKNSMTNDQKEWKSLSMLGKNIWQGTWWFPIITGVSLNELLPVFTIPGTSTISYSHVSSLSKCTCKRDRNLWSCDDRKGYSPEDQHFLSIFPNETAA